MTTKIINLDTLAKPTPVVLVVDGERHEMQAPTVETFVENLKLIEKLGTEPSMQKEIEAAVTIISRAFPSLKPDAIQKWPIGHLKNVSDLARGAGDEIVTGTEPEPSGNVLKAT